MPLFEASGIEKTYGATVALSGVSLVLHAGEVHALVGENGAGKSTLSHILCGLTSPDKGEMQLGGLPFAPTGKAESERLGVRIVLQELNLIPTLSVAENLLLQNMPTKLGLIDSRALEARARESLKLVGLEKIDPRTQVQELGIGVRQMIEIAHALSGQCRILILDEPTAALTEREAEHLFEHLIRLKQSGVAIVYVSHRMEEIQRIADRITVLRDGRVVASQPMAETSLEEVIRLMVGRELGEGVWRPKTRGESALRVEGLRAGEVVKGVSFDLHRGEILGVAGLMGSGRTETVRAVFGADIPDSVEIYLGGSPARIRGTGDAVRQGIALLTEDRKDQGLLLSRPIRENVTLTQIRKLASAGWIRSTQEATVANRLVTRLNVKCRSIEQTAGELSGGNQQKVALAKWIGADCEILLVDEPTRGIDVGAKFEIYALLNDLADQGKAILVVSSDLMELMALCDRIAVMSAGRIAETFSRNEWTPDKIMAAALSGYESSSNAEGRN